jgi:DNA-binding transcriptional regulator YiaG
MIPADIKARVLRIVEMLVEHGFSKEIEVAVQRMAKLKSFDVVRETWLKDYEVNKNYNALETEFRIAAEIIKARTNAQMTQAEFAEKLGTNKGDLSPENCTT